MLSSRRLCPKRPLLRKSGVALQSLSRSTCCRIVTGPERQQIARRDDWRVGPAIGEKAVADDLRLLLDPISRERLARLQPIAVAAEGVAHQEKIEAALRLRLPDVGHFVDEEA